MFVSKVNFCQFNTEIMWMLEIIVNKTKKAHAYVQREGFMAILKNPSIILSYFQLLTV